MQTDWVLVQWVLLWLAVAVVVLIRQWKVDAGVGLLFTHVLSFGVLHWFVPVVYLLPWYDTPWHDTTVVGLRESTLALMGFAVGCEFATRWVSRRHRDRPGISTEPGRGLIDARLSSWYLVIGIGLYGFAAPLARGIPTLNALVTAGPTLIVAAVIMKCWSGLQQRKMSAVWFWLLATAALPVFTVVTQGFLGYGLAAMLTVVGFLATVYRPRWKVIVAGIVMAYFGVSVFVTYMRDRGDIRRVVWGGAAVDDRFGRLQETLASFEWFDPYDRRQLARIEERLNQSFLVGAAVDYVRDTRTPLAYGGTIKEAAISLVPRALWPSKPVSAGSGSLVADYTGLRFDEETSVGVGQVLECYINFGTAGVMIGFFVIGALIVTVDRKARWALEDGDSRQFLIWYLPGLSLLVIGGSFVEATSGAGAALGVAAMLNFGTRLWDPSSPRPLARTMR